MVSINIENTTPSRPSAAGRTVGRKRLTFEDALGFLPQLREMISGEWDLTKEHKQLLASLVKVTLKWENSIHRTFKEAEDDAHMLTPKTTGPQLREDMGEFLRKVTQILVGALVSDPVWAAGSLTLLVDDYATLYNNYTTCYRGSTGSFKVQEGADFLKGVAATQFHEANGGAALKEALQNSFGNPAIVNELVDLASTLSVVKIKLDPAVVEACYTLAAEALLAVPEKSLVEKREDVAKALKTLLMETTPERGEAKPASRGPIEAAWKKAIVSGLRSTNLQARRAAADALADASRRNITAAELAPWLKAEKVLEELFGDRIDRRVLEELSLEPLCEPSSEGLRELLSGLERCLRHTVLYSKLHQLIIAVDGARLPAWGRDLVAQELMRWARGLLAEGRQDAVALVAGIFSCAERGWPGAGKGDYSAKRLIFFIFSEEAVVEAIEALVEALLTPGISHAQLVALEAAFDDLKSHIRGPRILEGLLSRFVNMVTAAANSGKLLDAAHLRLFLRILQCFPVEVEFAGLPDFTCEAALAKHTGLPDALMGELKRHIATEDVASDSLASCLRLRILCLVYRRRADLSIDEHMLQSLWTCLRPIQDGAVLCYLLRIATPTEKIVGAENTNVVLSSDAAALALDLLEKWAQESGGLSASAFFCLCQSIALVNAHEGRLTLLNEYGTPMKPESWVMGGVMQLAEGGEKGPPVQMIGRWVEVMQESGYYKLAQLAKYDEVTDLMALEYIDETEHRRKLANLKSLWFVPPISQQELESITVQCAKDLDSVKGCQGLWACALGATDDGVARRATDLLLALHQGPDGIRMLLSRLLDKVTPASSPGTIGRGLSLMETLVKGTSLANRRSHLGCGFPFRLTLVEYEYAFEEVPVRSYADGKLVITRKTVRKRKEVGTWSLEVHSLMIIAELYSLVSSSLGKRQLELAIRGELETTLNPYGQQTLEELEIGFGKTIEAEPTFTTEKPPVEGPLDELGSGRAAWLERLLELLDTPGIGIAHRSLCWQLLLRLPTFSELALQVLAPADRDWNALLGAKKLWRSAYTVLLIASQMTPLASDAVTPVLTRSSSAATAQAETWSMDFAATGGVKALLALFVDFLAARGMEAPSEDIQFELAAILPQLVSAVGFCTLSGRGAKETLGEDGGNALVKAAAQATRWLFDKSKGLQENEHEDWSRMRLRHAAANCLELTVALQRRAELPLSLVESLVLPLLCSIAGRVEGHVNSRVVAAIVEVARRPGTAPLLLRQVAAVVPQAAQDAAASESGVAPFFDIVLEALSNVWGQVKEAPTEAAELTAAVAKAALEAKTNVGSLFRLLKALLRSGAAGDAVPKLVSEVGSSLADRMLSCVLPEQEKALDDDPTRDQAAEALLYVLDASDWEMRNTVLKRVTGYLAETPTPTEYDFEPSVPKEPSTSLDALRNETGHVGLINRGSTCYMNSTVQQLFWSVPFRNAILTAPPIVADLTDRPQPLPDKSKEEVKPKPEPVQGPSLYGFSMRAEPEDMVKRTPQDVASGLQRMFAYMQDCKLGQFNTDQFVKMCSCLNLEYRVTSQNDAAEFLDKLLDAIDMAYKGLQLPNVFMAKTCREKYCHNCGARTRSSEDEMKRVQLNTLCDTLEECLDELTAAETMSGDNRVDCDKCGPKRDTTYRTFFTQLPQVLVLNLARIQFDLETLERVKKNPRIAFSEKLNMSKFTEDSVVNAVDHVPGCSYELQGVQIHQGSAGSGHYYSFAQDQQGYWMKFNDDRVGCFDLEDLEKECFGGEDYERQTRSGNPLEKSYNAYMLYYRCVDAAPYRAGQKMPEAERPPSSAGLSLTRSVSAQPPSSGLKPLGLARNVTQAFSGERLIEKQMQRRQAQAKAELLEDIRAINTRLHRQAVVFSQATIRFIISLVIRLFVEFSAQPPSAQGSPIVAAKVIAAQASLPECLCRITCKVIFDVLLHAQGCNEAVLKPWVESLSQQLAVPGSGAAAWLCQRLAGEPDQVLGRESSKWLPKVLFEFGRKEERFPPLAAVIASAAEATAAAGSSVAESCQHFLEALLMIMSSVDNTNAMSRYGKLWALLTEAPKLCLFIAAHRGQHSSPVSSLLVHLYIGETTPLAAPPAPPLPNQRLIARSKEAYSDLLKAVGSLLAAEPKLADERIVRSGFLWRQLASRNPEVFIKDSPLRQALPQDMEILSQVAQSIVEALRPTGMEDLVFSVALRAALAHVLQSGGATALTERLALLAELGRKLMSLATSNSTRATSYSSHQSSSLGTLHEDDSLAALQAKLNALRAYDFSTTGGGSLGSDSLRIDGSSLVTRRRENVGFSDGKGSSRNPEAIQLLRLVQVVALVCEELPESWSWARDWLLEVNDRKNRLRWAGEGLPLDEVKGLCTKFGLVDEKISAPGSSEENDVLEVSGAGQPDVDGQYVFEEYDNQGCPHYRNVANDCYALYRQKNAMGDICWVIAFLDPVLNGEPEVLYKTSYTMTQMLDSPFPPSKPRDWNAYRGKYPAPSVEVQTIL